MNNNANEDSAKKPFITPKAIFIHLDDKDIICSSGEGSGNIIPGIEGNY